MSVYEYAEKFTQLLQQKYAKELCSDDLAQSNPQVTFINAQTIKLPRMTVSGYKDHTRTPGFNAGTLSNDWEPKKLSHDRDIEFFVDAEMMLTKELVAKKVDAEWVKANTVQAETVVAINNELENIRNNYLKSNIAEIKYATIESLKGVSGEFEQFKTNDFTAITGKVNDLTVGVEKVNTLMFGSATGESITTDFANSVVSMIGTAQIKDSMIDSLDAKKIKALDIDTTDVKVHSKDGKSQWADNTIQISDSSRLRVQIGKDASGDYNMYVWDVKGNLMFDALGLTEQGVQREIIRNDMVKENANISAGKLDIASLFSVINDDGTHTLKSNKIYLDDAAQTLNVLLQDIKTGSGKDYSEWGSLLKRSDDFITQKLWWTENIDGTSVKEKFSNVNQTLQEYSVSLSNMAKYDDEIYLISYVPTKDNYPAWDWCVPVYPSDIQFPREETWQYNDTEWDKYIGKVAYWENEGRAWRFIRNEDGSHGWKEIPNSETAYMLKQNSALRINLDSISSSLSLTQQDLKGNYSTTTQMNNAITQAITKESNSIKLEVSGTYATKNDINNLQIGGRNLIRAYYIRQFDTGSTEIGEYTTSGKVVCQGNGPDTGFRFDSINCYEPSTQYILSGYITITSKSCNNIYVYNGKRHSFISFKIDGISYSNPFDIERTDAINILNDGKPHFFELRYETNANIPADVDISYTYIQLNKNNTTQINYEINGLKLEKGNKATDWSPAPEDVNAKFNNYATTASLEAYIKKDPTTGELKSAIEAIADDITLNASGTINISGNKSVNINGNLFTLTSTNTTISADGSIDCKKLKAVNADLEGTFKNVNVTEEGITMTTTLIGGEYLMKSSTGAYLKIQGHFINLSNEDGTRNAVSIRRDGIYVDDYYYIRSGDAYYNLMDWIRHSETAGTVDISGNNCYIEGYYYIRHHGEWWKLEDYVKDIANN